jgi:hypothetical protein
VPAVPHRGRPSSSNSSLTQLFTSKPKLRFDSSSDSTTAESSTGLPGLARRRRRTWRTKVSHDLQRRNGQHGRSGFRSREQDGAGELLPGSVTSFELDGPPMPFARFGREYSIERSGLPAPAGGMALPSGAAGKPGAATPSPATNARRCMRFLFVI